ncbi:MAG TPA: peptidylprolyl isomerase, partial [Rhodocyclaceae bacterium]|nr:peptidylprolyl isomerase [Rhodocyclaceae bacterium]
MQRKSNHATFRLKTLPAVLLGALLSAGLVMDVSAATQKKASTKKVVKKAAPLAVGKPGGQSNALATVNGVPIPQVAAETFVAEQVAQGMKDGPELRNAVRDELVRREVVSQAARAEKIDKQPEIIAQIELSKQAILIRAYVQNHLKKNPTAESDIQAEYDRLKAASTDKEYKSRHILVETEDAAKAIIAKLAAGEKFETLATQSKDPGSKDTGGDLGWSQTKDFVKPFGDALVTLEKGKYTATPVKSEFGWHVIQLEDVRTAEPPPYEHVKAQL